jgi:hypothetical protein
MRQTWPTLNRDLVAQHPDDVSRVPVDKGEIRHGYRGQSQDGAARPVVHLTASQLRTAVGAVRRPNRASRREDSRPHTGQAAFGHLRARPPEQGRMMSATETLLDLGRAPSRAPRSSADDRKRCSVAYPLSPAQRPPALCRLPVRDTRRRCSSTRISEVTIRGIVVLQKYSAAMDVLQGVRRLLSAVGLIGSGRCAIGSGVHGAGATYRWRGAVVSMAVGSAPVHHTYFTHDHAPGEAGERAIVPAPFSAQRGHVVVVEPLCDGAPRVIFVP